MDQDGVAVTTITSVSAKTGKTRDFYVKYFRPSDAQSASILGVDLPESYFSLTPSELQRAHATQVKRREQLIDAPLLTQALRDREQAAKLKAKASRWPQTRVRVRFADRSLLETVVASESKFIVIDECVRCALRDPALSFVLYQTPPRKEYVRTDPELKGKTLIDLQLTPSSVFYIKFSDEQYNSAAVPPPLRDDILANQADLPVPAPPSATDTPEDATASVPAKRTLNEKALPTWLKLGNKKK